MISIRVFMLITDPWLFTKAYSISVGIDEYRTYRLYAYNDFLTDLTS